MNTGNGGGGGGGSDGMGMLGMRASLFTVSQWQELQHQALIFKYMMAGLPVPPDLLLPIQKSVESISHRFFHHPTMGYSSIYGKKVDRESGRCRRTDGKKWRCAKDAYPDSKYCERHMHRGRNRSRKPVESQTTTESSSTVTSPTITGSISGPGSFQNVQLHAYGIPQGTASATNQPQYPVDSISYGIPSKDYRYLQGIKPDVGEHSFFNEASGSNRGLEMDSPRDRDSSLTRLKPSNTSILQNDYPQLSFFNGGFTSGEHVKQEGHPLRPFFDEWPKTRDSWSGLEDERSHQTLSMTSSHFTGTSYRSPHGAFQI